MKYLIQAQNGSTIHAFTTKQARDRKLAELQARYSRTTYITKETK